ncbi:MAG: hypothetical protein IJH75_05935 [Mogibacterium sp.]|nr:hypothetical protein [Mogibacterium sp.]
MSIRNEKIARRQAEARTENALVTGDRGENLTVLRTPDLPMDIIRTQPLPKKPLFLTLSEAAETAVTRYRALLIVLILLLLIGSYMFRYWQREHYPSIRTDSISVRLHASEVGTAVNVLDEHFYFYPYETFTIGSFSVRYGETQEAVIREYFETTMRRYTWEDLSAFDCAESFGELPAAWYLGHGYDDTGTERTVLLGFSEVYDGQVVILNAHVADPDASPEEIRRGLREVFLEELQVKLT